MKITVAKDAGYCFGVRDAVNMAYDATNKYGEVYMLGSIVHNEKVVKDLEKSGAKIVDSLTPARVQFQAASIALSASSAAFFIYTISAGDLITLK